MQKPSKGRLLTPPSSRASSEVLTSPSLILHPCPKLFNPQLPQFPILFPVGTVLVGGRNSFPISWLLAPKHLVALNKACLAPFPLSCNRGPYSKRYPLLLLSDPEYRRPNYCYFNIGCYYL